MPAQPRLPSAPVTRHGLLNQGAQRGHGRVPLPSVAFNHSELRADRQRFPHVVGGMRKVAAESGLARAEPPVTTILTDAAAASIAWWLATLVVAKSTELPSHQPAATCRIAGVSVPLTLSASSVIS